MANQMFQTNTGTTENFTVVFTGSDSCTYFRYGRERLFESNWFSGIGIPSSQKRPVFTGIYYRFQYRYATLMALELKH